MPTGHPTTCKEPPQPLLVFSSNPLLKKLKGSALVASGLTYALRVVPAEFSSVQTSLYVPVSTGRVVDPDRFP